MIGDPERVRGLAMDYRQTSISESDLAMLDYVVLLTRDPHAAWSGAADLRNAGFSDAAILDICQIAAYYNYVNRLAEGLAVQMEEYWTEEMMTLSRSEFEERRRRRKEGS